MLQCIVYIYIHICMSLCIIITGTRFLKSRVPFVKESDQKNLSPIFARLFYKRDRTFTKKTQPKQGPEKSGFFCKRALQK